MSSFDFLKIASPTTAKLLLGCVVERTYADGSTASGMIVETEYYEQSDIASHSYRGKTPRNEVMFGPAGHLYVYFTYGMHYCCNVVIGKPGYGAAVLLRAIEPLTGRETMAKLRHKPADSVLLTNGPAKLCQALRIDKTLNGHNLNEKPLILRPGIPINQTDITRTTRIGISQAKDLPLRFYLTGNRYISLE